jgi:hypothetical protein
MPSKKNDNPQYSSIINHIFQSHWKKGLTEFEFHRDEMIGAAISG